MEPTVQSQTPAQASQLPGPSDLLKTAWSIVKDHWKAYASLLAIPIVVNIIAQLFLRTKDPVMLIGGLLLVVVYVILAVLMQIALIDTARKLSNGSSAAISAKEEYAFARGKFWSYIWVGILTCLFSVGSIIIGLIPAVVIGGLMVLVQNSVLNVLAAVIVSLSIIVCIFVIAIYAAFSTYSLVIGEGKGLSNIIESIALVRGRWWSVFWRLLCIAVVSLILGIVGGIIQLLISVIFGPASGSAVTMILQLIASAFVSMFIYSLSVTYLYNFYRSLRSTKIESAKPLVSRKLMIAACWIGLVIGLAMLVIPFVIGVAAGYKNAMIQSRLSSPVNYSATNQP